MNVTATHCQDKVRQSFRMSCFTEKSVRYAIPKAENGYVNIAEELWVTLSFFTVFGSCLHVLPTYSVNIISFLSL